MEANLRACLAHVASRLIKGRSQHSVYDHSQAKNIHITGSVHGNLVRMYDHDRHAYIVGTLPNLYHQGLAAWVSLRVEGLEFRGTDQASKSRYTGRVSGNTVVIFDFELGAYFHYSV